MPETIRMTAVTESRPRDSHIFQRDATDHYVEPNWVSARLFEVEEFNGPVLDPAVGWGRITTAAYHLNFQTMGCDIVNRHPCNCSDFRLLNFTAVLEEKDYSWLSQAGAVVTNPPFNLLREFTLRACSLMTIGKVTKVALIFPVRRLPAAHWLEQLPLARVLMLSPRPSMPTSKHILAGGSVGGGTVDYSWAIFQRDYKGQPSMGWLHRDAETPQN
jgi:hypothetical protein